MIDDLIKDRKRIRILWSLCLIVSTINIVLGFHLHTISPSISLTSFVVGLLLVIFFVFLVVADIRIGKVIFLLKGDL